MLYSSLQEIGNKATKVVNTDTDTFSTDKHGKLQKFYNIYNNFRDILFCRL